MRVLVTTSPGVGHMFATVPLSWAFRAAGHEVLFATAGRSDHDLPAIAGAGLPVAEIASREQIGDVRTALWRRRQAEADWLGLTLAEMVERDIETSRQARHVTGGNGWAFATRIFGPMSRGMLEGLIDVATCWKPDLVIFESMQGGGPLVAAKLGVPAVEHPIGFARGPEVVEALARDLADEYARYGVCGLPERMVALDVSPPSMAVGPDYGWTMRYVPFNGGGVITEWLSKPARVPRIAVTLGSVVPERGVEPFARIVEAASDAGAELMLTATEEQLLPLGTLPANVRACGYVPLGTLLLTCDGVVHHGGSSTTLTALDAGVPQLVLPQLADHFINAEAVRRRGCGIVAEDGVGAGMLLELLHDGRLQSASAEVRAEMASLPPPAEIVSRLVEMAG